MNMNNVDSWMLRCWSLYPAAVFHWSC